MVAATFIGLYIGIYLDKWLETAPWMTLIWLGIGIVAGFATNVSCMVGAQALP